MKPFPGFRNFNLLFRVLTIFLISGPLTVIAQDKGLSEVVAADGIKLRFAVEGKGIPCVVVNRSNYQQVYSKELRKHLKLIFLDLRHGSEADPPAKVDYVTLDTLVDDIEQVRKALGIERIAVMGHSLPSVIALEYARKYPEHTSHVILISSPPYFIPPKDRQAFWETDASADRKLADQHNRERITEKDMQGVSPGKRWMMQYIRDGARYWYNPSYDSSWMWQGPGPNLSLMMRVGGLLREYDVARRMSGVKTPVFLALGRYDYVVPYWAWNDRKEALPKLSYNLFEKSGHFAMMEEQPLFDKKLVEWIRKK